MFDSAAQKVEILAELSLESAVAALEAETVVVAVFDHTSFLVAGSMSLVEQVLHTYLVEEDRPWVAAYHTYSCLEGNDHSLVVSAVDTHPLEEEAVVLVLVVKPSNP